MLSKITRVLKSISVKFYIFPCAQFAKIYFFYYRLFKKTFINNWEVIINNSKFMV